MLPKSRLYFLSAIRDFEFSGYRIPEGSMVLVSALHTHYMEEWWNEPEKFDPERFSPERAEDQRHTHSYIPFGGGQHMCIGLRFAESQVKIVLHHTDHPIAKYFLMMIREDASIP